jgi:hypothetical protein
MADLLSSTPKGVFFGVIAFPMTIIVLRHFTT